MEHEPYIGELQAAWLEGYRKVAPFAREHEDALPMLIMLRRMQLTAWIASHAETPTAQAMGEAYTDGHRGVGGTLSLKESVSVP